MWFHKQKLVLSQFVVEPVQPRTVLVFVTGGKPDIVTVCDNRKYTYLSAPGSWLKALETLVMS